MNDYRDFAIDLAKEAGAIIRQNFTLGMKKEWKEDHTPITATDKAVNDLALSSIQHAFPDHDIIAEEGSPKLQGKDFVWVCDPVDGTSPFSHGIPLMTFSLGLVYQGESLLGVVYDPMLDRLFVGEKGRGVLLNGKPISVSTRGIARETVEFTWGSLNPLNITPTINALYHAKARITINASTAYGSMLVACGEFVGEIYTYDKPWDGAAVKVIVEEAGGKVTSLEGKEQRYDRPINGFIASNGVVHDELVALIAQSLKNP